MKARPLLLVAALAMAGCASSDDAPGGGSRSEDDDPAGTSGPRTSAPGTTTSGVRADRGPVATLQANATAGVAPLAVRFALSGVDPDGDALSWRLAVEGQPTSTGSTLPATVDRVFPAGSWQVELVVQDARSSDAALLTILAQAPDEPPVQLNATYRGIDPTANRTLAGTTGGCRLGDPATPGGPVGGGWHDLPAAAADRDYAVAPQGKGFAAYFLGADGALVGAGGDAGIVPIGATRVRICTADATAGGTYAFTAVPAFRLASAAFPHGGKIPARYTCNGADAQPPLTFKRLPEGTTHLALILDDPDAPGGTFIHWVWWDLPAGIAGLAEDEALSTLGAAEGDNDFGERGWGGPCPPPGTSHRYQFRLYALSAPAGVAPGSSAAQLSAAMEGKVLGETLLTGLYP